MTSPIQALIATGTKLWLDSIDPELVVKNREMGATGATSNPIIVADLIKTGRFDSLMQSRFQQGLSDEDVAWAMTDHLVSEAEKVFLPVYEESKGNNGYVSFELDPLLEDSSCELSTAERTAKYIELGQRWSKEHPNRMIKIPATPAGLGAIEDLIASGVPLNVTLIFSERQYKEAREATIRGASRCPDKNKMKSVYSIFVSRLDVYSEKHVSDLKPESQGWLGILNAKRIWKLNQEFWADKGFALDQEIVFASTGTKKPSDPVYKYVEAFAGSDIETNPPATNDGLEASGHIVSKSIDLMPVESIIKDIDEKVDFQKMEDVLMSEGLSKFAEPQKGLIQLITSKRP